MAHAKELKNIISTRSVLGNNLEGLAFLLDNAHTQQSDYGFFSHLCNFVVPFLHKSKKLQPLRDQWTDQRNEHVRKERKLQQQAIKEITTACDSLKQRLKRSRLKEKKNRLTQLDKVYEVLTTGGPYLGPPFYQTAFNQLWQLCRSLADQNNSKLLDGIATIGDLDNPSSPIEKPRQIKRPHLESVEFNTSLNKLHEHQKIMEWERVDTPWVIWEYLCIAEQCWHLPQSYFEEQGLQMGTPSQVKKSNYLFNLRGYWYDMQCIRQQRKQDVHIISFTRKRYVNYLEHITSALVYWHHLLEEAETDTGYRQFYSAELILDGNELHLQIEEQKGGAQATFFVHACQEGATPLVFFNNLLENVGNPVEVPDTSPGSQTASKLLNALKLTGPLRDLFFKKGTTNSATLKHKKAVLEKCTNVDSKKLHKQIRDLKLLEGALSLINYEGL